MDHRISGTEKTIYWERASIGEIPDYVTKNNIVVTSSNNGAVQNIVNDLPLSSGIDKNLINKLKDADYFYDIANSKISTEWIEDGNW
ncbi:MAG: hypothetical protein RR920_08880 [Lachnospiraceae bacterium]